MRIFILEKGFIYKLFMFIAFSIFALVMYQGYLKGEFIYKLLFFGSIALCSFQIASIFYVIFVKREIEISIDENSVSWKIFDNKKVVKEVTIIRKTIKEVKTEIAYLTGNIYSNFAVTFILDDKQEIKLTDGLIYDFGLTKAEELTKFLLENDLGDKQDIKLTKLVKELNIDLTKEQKFTKKAGDSFYLGVISKRKKEFLSLRLQIEALYKDYTIIETNTNNAYLIKSSKNGNSFIFLKSNVFGYFIEFYKVEKIEQIKMLQEMGRQKISLL
ncbi:putative membrane protein [Halarcobacter ebronensis]|uniref:Uncharacterized protein n=2 Tax=Halarcobacter ebronensis TaxID=1462615 RepID=A0A4Q1ALS5_9BACT|nr:putative membrane protein [Halarcobacter ebronensis]RXK06341.1 hypothetical protein CRV07_06505 [Halarcobacter ebronensis]